MGLGRTLAPESSSPPDRLLRFLPGITLPRRPDAPDTPSVISLDQLGVDVGQPGELLERERSAHAGVLLHFDGTLHPGAGVAGERADERIGAGAFDAHGASLVAEQSVRLRGTCPQAPADTCVRREGAGVALNASAPSLRYVH